jgi:hypothetical protein
MSTYRREHYLAKLRPFYNDSGLIKVITGIRRCGQIQPAHHSSQRAL